MRWDYLMIVALFSLGTFLFAAAIFILTRKERIVGIRIVGFMAVINCIFMFGYGCFLLADAIPTKVYWNSVQYIAIPFFAPLWYLLSIKQKNSPFKLQPWLVAAVMVLPVLSMISRFLYPLTGGESGSWVQLLFFEAHQAVTYPDFGEGFVGLIFLKGSMYFLQMGFNAFLGILTVINYVILLQKEEKVARKRTLLLLITSIVVFGWVVLSLWNNWTAIIDSSPFVTGFLSFMTFLLLFKYELFDLIPTAYREIFQKSNIPILILDRDYNIVRINPSAKLLLNGQLTALDKWSLRSFETFDPGIFSDLATKNEHEWCLCREEKEQCFQIRLNTLYGNKQSITGFTIYYQDITIQKNELKRMEGYAEFDDLTKIRNRRSFFKKAIEQFDQAIVEKQKITVIMFDLDDFKEINDIYGHQAGDVVLQDMAKLFKPEFSENDLFARYGGEEFIIFQRNRSIEDAQNLADRLCTMLYDHIFLYERHPIKTSASFGVAGTTRQIDKSFEHYIKDADEACYNAKSLGKHRVFVYSENK